MEKLKKQKTEKQSLKKECKNRETPGVFGIIDFKYIVNLKRWIIHFPYWGQIRLPIISLAHLFFLWNVHQNFSLKKSKL